MAENPEKTRTAYNKAMEVKQMSIDMVDYIENLKAELISLTEGISIEEAKTISASKLRKRDNYDIPTTFLIGQDQTTGKDGRANMLKEKIIE